MTTAIEHAGFLAAIIEELHDDFHRIVYADWLEEQGEEERAEFIRVQVELAKAPEKCLKPLCDGEPPYNDCEDCIRVRRMYARMEDLWYLPARGSGFTEESSKGWALTIGGAIPDCQIPQLLFRRGFVAEIHGLTFNLWREHGPRLVRQHPLELVKLAGEWLIGCDSRHYTHVVLIPQWFKVFYATRGAPPRHTREEAEKYLSGVLIAWAKAQPLPQGEER